ncbi:hypothetical protein MATL_G00113770 [Megalops atlanticus]|uniref:CARD domain-containing protein n=1 Tax=Megalops atlanticus TaxID=7932 RepID=A0A9D3Q080_MEGAT|nr:hypothetical protein MATL_G00113770 [Megalops atlanticus]
MEPRDFARFVDKHWAELVQRVTMVMPMADELLSLGMLHEETYSQIIAARTSQEKMRELFTALHSGGDKVKCAFYCALKDHQPHLLQDLEEQRIGDLSIRSSALTGDPVIAPGHKHTTGTSRGSFPVSYTGSSNPADTHSQNTDLISVSLKYKELICSEYTYVTEYNSLPGEHVVLTDRYTELLIIQRHREQNGFDELKLSQDNMSNLSLPSDVQTPASPESTLKALLSGRLLPESFLLVTTSLNLTDCSLTPETLKILQPAVSRSEELELDLRDFSDDDVGLLISALGEEKKLNNLSLTNSLLSDQGVQKVLNSLSKQRSVGEVYLTVKTITTNTAIILMNHFHNSKITGSISVQVNENSHEESLCSCLRTSNTVSGVMVSVEEYSRSERTSERSKPRSGTLIYGISVIFPHSKITNVNWTNFLQIFHKIKDLTEICPGFDENLKALLSFLISEPDLMYVKLEVAYLTESWTTKILPHLQVFPNLKHISVGCVGSEFHDRGISWSLSGSQADENLMLSFKAQDLKNPLFRISNSPTPLSLSEFCLTGPQSELFNISWKSFVQMLYKCEDKPMTEIGEDFEEKMDALLSVLPSVSGLKKVKMKMSDLTVNWAVRILSLIQTCPSLQCITIDLNGSYAERFCSSLTVSSTNGDLTLTCPYSEMSNINWTRFLEIFYRLKGLLEISPEFNEHVNALLSFLNSVPGLKFLSVEVASLTESWVTRILSLIQTCPSLQCVSLKVYGLSVDGLLLEEGICLLEDSQKRPECALIVHGSRCTKLTDQCTERENICSLPCNQRVKLLYHNNCFMLSTTDDNMWWMELLPSHIDSTQNKPSLLGMNFICPDSEMSCDKWTRFLQMFSQIRMLTETCPEFNEQMDALLSFLNSVPHLKKVMLYVDRLTENWAARILSLIQTCPSLRYMSLKAVFLLEEGIESLQNSEKRPDCTLTVEGFRCTKPTDQCTEHDEFKPNDCNQKVKLKFCGESFTVTGPDG